MISLLKCLGFVLITTSLPFVVLSIKDVDISTLALRSPSYVYPDEHYNDPGRDGELWEGLKVEDWLEEHNWRRCRYGGQYVVWDHDLAASAMLHAQTMPTIRLTSDKYRPLYDEGFPNGPSYEIRSKQSEHKTAFAVLEDWFDSFEDSLGSDFTDLTQAKLDAVSSKASPPFLAVIWKDVVAIGCAFYRPSSTTGGEQATWYVCRYKLGNDKRIPEATHFDTEIDTSTREANTPWTRDCTVTPCRKKFNQEDKCRAHQKRISRVYEDILERYRENFSTEVAAWTRLQTEGLNTWVADHLDSGSNELSIGGTSDESVAFNSLVFRGESPPTMNRQRFDVYFGKSKYLNALSYVPNFWKTDSADWFRAINLFRCRYNRRPASWNYGLALSLQKYVDLRDFSIESMSEISDAPDGPAFEIRLKSEYALTPLMVIRRFFEGEEDLMTGKTSPWTLSSIISYARTRGPKVENPCTHWTAIQWRAIKQFACASSFDGTHHACRLFVGTTVNHPDRVNNPDPDAYSRNVGSAYGDDNAQCWLDTQERYTLYLKFMDIVVAKFGCIPDAWRHYRAAIYKGDSFNDWCEEVFEFQNSQCVIIEPMFGGDSGTIVEETFSGVIDDGLWEYAKTRPPSASSAWTEATRGNAVREKHLSEVFEDVYRYFDDDESASHTIQHISIPLLLASLSILTILQLR